MNCRLCHEPMTALFGHETADVGVYETEYVCENVGCYNYNKIIFVWTEVKKDTIL